MKKYLIITALLFILPSSALAAAAAKQPKGQVPQLEPLQPAPEFTAPNISNNIQFVNGSQDSGEAPEGDTAASGDAGAASRPAGNAGTGQMESLPAETSKPASHAVRNWSIAIVAVVVVGLGYAWKRNQPAN